MFGINGVVLAWLRSYLSNRSYRVVYAGHSSGNLAIRLIICSVPQGSVLGLLLFILYTADVSDLAAKHYVKAHSLADDTQLYRHCTSTSAEVMATVIGDYMSHLSTSISSAEVKPVQSSCGLELLVNLLSYTTDDLN